MKINILIGLLLTVMIGGCYTVYNHPNVVHKDDNNRVDIIEVSYRNDCQSCHTESDLEKYNYYVKKEVFTETDITSDSSEVVVNDIAYYYNMPWWYEIVQSNEYSPVIYSTGGGSLGVENEDRRGYLPPIILDIPQPTRNSEQPTSGGSTTTRTNSGNTKESSNSSSNTRNNDGSKKTNTGRK